MPYKKKEYHEHIKCDLCGEPARPIVITASPSDENTTVNFCRGHYNVYQRKISGIMIRARGERKTLINRYRRIVEKRRRFTG